MSVIESKNCKIIVSADVKELSELWKLIEQIGDIISILKIHYDIIEDFNTNIVHTIYWLNFYKKKFKFLIWEDRKFADIGYIMKRQIDSHIKKWADIVSVHPIAGLDSVKELNFIKVILIGEMSSSGTLTDESYKSKVAEMVDKLPNVIGVVCQTKMTDTKYNIVPGICKTNKKTDSMGQQYNDPKDRSFADFFVVGRDIIHSNKPREKLLEYINLTN